MMKIKEFFDFVRFLFPGKDEDDETDNWFKKEKQAIEMLESLYRRYTKMRSTDIIDELYRIHNFHRVPSFPFWDKRSLYFYNILFELKKRSASEQWSDYYLQLILDMLFWDETTLELDSSYRLIIMEILELNPRRFFIEKLEEHLNFINNIIDCEQWGTHYYVDVTHEKTRVEDLLKKCKEANR